MTLDLAATFSAVLTLLSIINPIVAVPMFAELAADLDRAGRRRLVNTAVATAFMVLVILTFTGHWIMDYIFHISVAEFRIAGGILLTVIAVNQIAFHKSESHSHDPKSIMELGAVPLGFPILVGPGAIVSSILILDRDGWLVAVIALVVSCAITWLVVAISPQIARLLGRYGTMVVARVLWIFIAAIAVSFLVSGIHEVFGVAVFGLR